MTIITVTPITCRSITLIYENTCRPWGLRVAVVVTLVLVHQRYNSTLQLQQYSAVTIHNQQRRCERGIVSVKSVLSRPVKISRDLRCVSIATFLNLETLSSEKSQEKLYKSNRRISFYFFSCRRNEILSFYPQRLSIYTSVYCQRRHRVLCYKNANFRIPGHNGPSIIAT